MNLHSPHSVYCIPLSLHSPLSAFPSLCILHSILHSPHSTFHFSHFAFPLLCILHSPHPAYYIPLTLHSPHSAFPSLCTLHSPVAIRCLCVIYRTKRYAGDSAVRFCIPLTLHNWTLLSAFCIPLTLHTAFYTAFPPLCILHSPHSAYCIPLLPRAVCA